MKRFITFCITLILIALLVSPAWATDRRRIYSGANELSVSSGGNLDIDTVTTVTTVADVTTLGTITNAVEQSGHASFGSTVVIMTGNIATPIMVTAQACKRAIVSNPIASLGTVGDIRVGDSNVNDGCADLEQQGGQTDFDYAYEGIVLDEGDYIELFVDNLSDIYITTSVATGTYVTVTWEN